MSCPGYIDKSKRRPYICGLCGLDIRDPSHQPMLLDIRYFSRVEEVDGVDAPEEAVPPSPDQMKLF